MSTRYDVDQIKGGITVVVNTAHDEFHAAKFKIQRNCWVCDRQTYDRWYSAPEVFAGTVKVTLKTGAQIYLCEGCATLSNLGYYPRLFV